MRRKDREVTDRKELYRIIEKAKILRLGLMDETYPYVVPVHFGFECTFGTWVFYMHCAGEGKKLDLIRKNPHVCVEMDCEAELISGGEEACRYGSSYASVIGFGKAEIVEDTEAKIHALSFLMQNQTGKTFAFTKEMTDRVAVIRVTLDEISGKERRKPDEA